MSLQLLTDTVTEKSNKIPVYSDYILESYYVFQVQDADMTV